MAFSHALKRTEQLLLRWAEEPIGVLVPVAAFFAVWLPPQMPDMFAGMEAPIWRMQISARPFLFAIAAMTLGLSAWFWTRAALTAQMSRGETDKARILRKRTEVSGLFDDEDLAVQRQRRTREDEHIEWSYEWAPRMALLFAGGITVLPIMFAIRTGQFFTGLLGAELLSFGLVGLLYVFVLHRTEFRWMNAFDAPRWMMRSRAARVLAFSPFGWPFAILSLACSFVAFVCVAIAPDFVAQFDAPTTAIAALSFAVGPLVMALAVMRDLVERAIYILRFAVNRGEAMHFMPGEAHRVKRVASVLGTIMLALWFLSPPWVLEKHVVRLTSTVVKEPLGSAACAPASIDTRGVKTVCRPDLKAALQEWVDARRRADPGRSERLPVVIVAASGGASRAAAWLVSSMRMLDFKTNGDFGRHLFAISGVSGGALGATTYARLVRAQGREDGTVDWEAPAARAALARFATKDLLSGTIATYFLNDMFGSMVGPLWTWGGIPDRNTALEHTFDAMWAKNKGFALPRHVPEGFLGLRFSPQSESRAPVELLPHLLLNGTDVVSGKRMITSTIRSPADRQLFADSGDFLALVGHDIRLATAVTNSARFPFISPAGRFVSTRAMGGGAFQIIDGGYFENYGARTVWELARAIEDLNAADPSLNVVPIVVVISNDVETDQPPRAVANSCRTMMEDVALDGSQITIRCDEPVRSPQCSAVEYAGLVGAAKADDRSIVPQSMAPLLGLAATRSAHGRDALNILRRDFCKAQTSAPNDPKTRMIHIALPRPNPSKGEAAPMNWVLSPAACDYLVNKAPFLPFNVTQAAKLKGTLDAILGAGLRSAQPERPMPIDCGGG
ncbi:MAG: hypothetical protein KBA31_15860 [Alphaproteobacteria bacterium]|nr:hypothetical protein [Alphaproteobacteria bacterium]